VSIVAGPNGGSAITNYQYSIDGGDSWTTRSPASPSSPMLISGLDNGVAYPVRPPERRWRRHGLGVAVRDPSHHTRRTDDRCRDHQRRRR
jgi:hypothetical protein